MEYQQEHSPSFRRKLKISILCASSCCNCDDDNEESKALESPSENHKSTTSLATWIKSELPEIKGIFAGKIGRNRHRVNSAADFRYDPLSYALNFEDDVARFDDHYPLRNFSSRLPPSPSPEKENVVVSRQIAAFS